MSLEDVSDKKSAGEGTTTSSVRTALLYTWHLLILPWKRAQTPFEHRFSSHQVNYYW